MIYPTLEAAKTASRLQLCKWYRFLPFAATESEIKVNELICERYNELGGMNSKLSKQIGWDAK